MWICRCWNGHWALRNGTVMPFDNWQNKTKNNFYKTKNVFLSNDTWSKHFKSTFCVDQNEFSPLNFSLLQNLNKTKSIRDSIFRFILFLKLEKKIQQNTILLLKRFSCWCQTYKNTNLLIFKSNQYYKSY